MGIGVLELLVIVGVLVLFLGPKKLPELAKSIQESKKILKDNKDAEEKSIAGIERKDETDA